MSKPKIVVIGAGVMGLSTAIQILEAVPQASVRIVAKSFNAMTTSDGAAGIFRPVVDHLQGLPRELLIQWIKDSFDHYDKLVHSADAKEAGASMVSGYHFFINSEPEKDRIYTDFVYNSQPCSEREKRMLFPGAADCYEAHKLTTLMIEGRWYLPYLMKQFKNLGGKVEQRQVENLEEFVGQCDVLVNCSGLGAIELVNDPLLTPNRGQMIRMKAPWLKHFLYVDHDCWIVPGRETVTVGGTRQLGDDDIQLRPNEAEAMMERACKYVPSLKEAEVGWHWVGIRPTRKPIRVETEHLKCGANTLKVVHNYGHSGHGIALSWGCSKYAAKLACQLLEGTSSKL